MNAPTTMTIKLPTYPQRWRRWLWYATRGRLAFPVWIEYEATGVQMKDPVPSESGGTVGVDFSFKEIRRVN